MADYFNFIKVKLDALQAMDSVYNVADTKVPGLRLFVYPSGNRTFVLYRWIEGRPERIKIGRYSDLSIEQARKEAGRLNGLIALGGNPAKDKKEKRADITFKNLFDIYYNQYALLHTKRPEDNKKMVEFHILPVIGSYKLGDIKSDKIRKMHSCIGTIRGTGTANRALAVVNAVFNFGIKNGYYKLANPCFGLVKFKEFSRDRFLSKEEIKKFIRALAMENELFQDFFSLLLYTGARKSNVLSMKWSDINLDLKLWRLSENETKNHDVNIINLSESSLGILLRRKEHNNLAITPSKFVFPSDSVDGHLKDPKKAFQRLRNRMEVQDIRMHDLRRTLASYMAISGASLPIIGKALNHKNQDSTAIYARLNNEPVLKAINEATALMLVD